VRVAGVIPRKGRALNAKNSSNDGALPELPEQAAEEGRTTGEFGDKRLLG
jgi:hypothetical protein